MASGIRREFSVILRARQPLHLKPSYFDIIQEIGKEVGRNAGIYTVAVSPPNYAIHFGSIIPQLHLLSRKTIGQENMLLDIVPWCTEYDEFSLPWPLIESSPAIKPNMTEAASSSQEHSSLTIGIDQHPLPMQGAELNMAKIDIPHVPHTELMAAQPSFSYLMIMEIMQFYEAKIAAFDICKEAYKQILELGKNFYEQVSPAIQAIDEQTYKYDAHPEVQENAEILTFADSLRNNLQHIAEEHFDLTFTSHLFNASVIHPIDFGGPRYARTNTQAYTPAASAEILRYTAYFVGKQVYGSPPVIKTNRAQDGYIDTEISCPPLHHRYRSPAEMTPYEAEAAGTYRFLKHISNVLGYIVGDADNKKLSAMVSQLNCLNIEIIELQYSVNKVVSMIEDVHQNIAAKHRQLKQQIQQLQIHRIDEMTTNLLQRTEGFLAAAKDGSHHFTANRVAYLSSKLASTYNPMPDETYGL